MKFDYVVPVPSLKIAWVFLAIVKGDVCCEKEWKGYTQKGGSGEGHFKYSYSLLFLNFLVFGGSLQNIQRW